MKTLTALILLLILGGCAASRQEVVARLGQEFVGQNVDKLILKFGPPAQTFRLNSGQGSFVWQLTAVTDIVGSDGYAEASTRFCKVSAVTSPEGIVTQLDTEDSNAGSGIIGALGGYGSICAHRLGMRPS